MAESGTYQMLAECGLRPNFKRQTGPILQAEPESCTSKDPSPSIHLATYLDSDSDEGILNVGQSINIDKALYSEPFMEFPHRTVSKRIDGEDVSILMQVNRKTVVQVCTVLHEMV